LPSIGVLVAVTLLLARAAGSPGWWTVFLHSFHGWLVDPARVQPFDAGLWAGTLVERIGEWNAARPLGLLAVVALATFLGVRRGRSAIWQAALALAGALVLRYLLFPALLPRFVAPYILLAGLLALEALSPAARPREGARPEPLEAAAATGS
jgi:hypothetical protein